VRIPTVGYGRYTRIPAIMGVVFEFILHCPHLNNKRSKKWKKII